MRDEKYITKIIAASLLGDMSLHKHKKLNSKGENNNNVNITIALLEKNKDHLEFIQSVVEPITTCTITLRDCYGKKDGWNRQPQCTLRSKKHPFFNKFHERMYGTGRKSVDPHYLTLLDWEFLAIWYMQNGYLSAYAAKGVYPQARVALCSQSFSYGENMNLRSALKEKLDLDWRVTNARSQAGHMQYFLTLAPRQIDMMLDNIQQYIQPSFSYKLDKQGKFDKIVSRTKCSSEQTEDDDMI